MKLFRNQYGEIRSGWAVSISMVVFIGAIMFLLGGMLLVLLSDLDGSEFYQFFFIISIIIEQGFMFLIACLIFKIAYRRPVSQMGLTKEKWLSNFFGGILFGLVIFSVVAGGLVITKSLSFTGMNPGFYKEFGFYMSLSTFSAGFGEEMLCRGLLTFQMKTTRNKYAIIIVPSLIFSLLHLLNTGITAISLANIFLVGALLCVLLMRTGSLWFCIGVHGMWNLVQGGLYGIKVSGFETAGVLASTLSGPQFLAGGDFGAEGSIVTTITLIAAIAISFVIFKNPVASGWSFDGHLPLVRYPKKRPSI